MKQRKRTQKTKGFTLIETIISLLLVSMALLMACKIIVYTREAHQKSRARFSLLQEMESHKNRLMAMPFEATQLKPGKYSLHEGERSITLTIEVISPTLKVVRMFGVHTKYRAATYKIRFYISKLFKEKSHD